MTKHQTTKHQMVLPTNKCLCVCMIDSASQFISQMMMKRTCSLVSPGYYRWCQCVRLRVLCVSMCFFLLCEYLVFLGGGGFLEVFEFSISLMWNVQCRIHTYTHTPTHIHIHIHMHIRIHLRTQTSTHTHTHAHMHTHAHTHTHTLTHTLTPTHTHTHAHTHAYRHRTRHTDCKSGLSQQQNQIHQANCPNH